MRKPMPALFVFAAFVLFSTSPWLLMLRSAHGQKTPNQAQPSAQQPAFGLLPEDQKGIVMPSGQTIASTQRMLDDQGFLEQTIRWWGTHGAKTASDQAVKPQGEAGLPLGVTIVWAHVAVDQLRKAGGLKQAQSILELIVGPVGPYDFWQGGGPDQRCSGAITNWRQSIAFLEGLRDRGLARLFWSAPVTIANRKETEIVLMPAPVGTTGNATTAMGPSPKRFQVVLDPILLEDQRVLLVAEPGVHFADEEKRIRRARVTQPVANGGAIAIGGRLFETYVATKGLKLCTPIVSDIPWLGSLVTKDSQLAKTPLVGIVVPQTHYEDLEEQMLMLLHIQRSRSTGLIAAPGQ